jgi:phosphoglycolate phosphatase
VRRLVVFDLDGTLIDSSADLATAVNRGLQRVAPGSEPLRLETVRGMIGEGARNLVAKSLAEAGLTQTPEEFLPVFLECYSECLLDRTLPYPGVKEALDLLDGLVLAVLTNKPGDMSRRILEGLAMRDRFFRVYGGGDLPTRKPDPEGLRRLLDEAEARPEEAVMVGDSAIDVLTGRGAGVFTVGVSYGLDPDSLRREPPDVLIDDLRELPALLRRF